MSKSITRKLFLVLTLSLAAILAVVMLVDYRISRNEILGRLRLQSFGYCQLNEFSEKTGCLGGSNHTIPGQQA